VAFASLRKIIFDNFFPVQKLIHITIIIIIIIIINGSTALGGPWPP